MNIREAQFLAKLLRWTTGRIVSALRSGPMVESYRHDQERHQREDDELIAEYFPVWANPRQPPGEKP